MKRPVRSYVSESSLILMGVPKHFCKIGLEDFKTYEGVKEVKVFVKDYIDHLDQNIEENKGIFFCGSNGVGKSMLSCIILILLHPLLYVIKKPNCNSAELIHLLAL